MMTDWAATTRLSARVTLAEGLVIQGDLHLQTRVAWRDGPETPLDLLNREETFFVMSLPTGEVVFVCKEQVASLLCREGALQPDPARETVARHIPLEVMMTGGAEFRGEAVSELPPTRSRALDFLNGQERFFSIHNNDGTCCLNRRFVRAVRPSGA
jgi:hypothetical protein